MHVIIIRFLSLVTAFFMDIMDFYSESRLPWVENKSRLTDEIMCMFIKSRKNKNEKGNKILLSKM